MKKVLLALLLLSASQSYAQVPTTNLEAYFPFSGNANDESVNTNNGAVTGATLVTDRHGILNSAYSFFGRDR